MNNWVVIMFDQEENTPSDSAMGTYGTFNSPESAYVWANKKFSELANKDQEYRGFAVMRIVSPEIYANEWILN